MNYGSFKVLNPTPFKIKAGFDKLSKNGAEYVFEPYEEKEIFVKDHVDHICISKQRDGLVQLNYNDEAKKTYKTYEDYKIARSIEGINQAMEKYNEGLAYERAAEAAAKLKDQVIELRTINVDKFESKIKDLNELASVLKKPETKTKPEVKAVIPDWMKGIGSKEVKTEVKKETIKTSDIKTKVTKNGRVMIDEGKGFKFVKEDKLKELGIDATTIKNES